MYNFYLIIMSRHINKAKRSIGSYVFCGIVILLYKKLAIIRKMDILKPFH